MFLSCFYLWREDIPLLKVPVKATTTKIFWPVPNACGNHSLDPLDVMDFYI
jgi:hypothetical protein